ncbi:hypothetical protein RQP46_003291 [Phenoliferia psychrophenolica]
MEANNPNPTLVTYCLAIINSTAFLSRVSSGALADRFGVLNTAIPFTACTGILCFAMLGATNTPGAVIWMLLYGFANGAFVTILSPILMSLAKDVSEIGLSLSQALLAPTYADHSPTAERGSGTGSSS